MPVALLCLVAFLPPEDPGDDPAANSPAVEGPVIEKQDVDPATAPLPPAKTLEDGVRVWGNLPFRRAGGETLRMDLAIPPLDIYRADPPRTPLLVFVHGGGWVAGTKLRYQSEILARARGGAAAATIEYRLSRVAEGGKYVAPFPAALEDVRAALAFLVDRADELNIDPARIALIGDSAGGHLSLLAALSANETPGGDRGTKDEPNASPRIPVAAVVNLFGVTDMPAYYTGSRHARSVLSLFLEGHLAVRQAAYEAASPVRFIDADDPPVLTLHGTADPVVPYDQAEILHETLKEAGVSNELVPVPGGTHGLFRERGAVRNRVSRFLAAQLRPAAKVPAAGGP
ncbi:alpha/beta hydrolase [Alienimonas chondri]|uniref:Acetyl esterase n=1 Tax=Alienimonas chondri TaxID=2681879 RepID=A0ABX1VE92_9PLAN|nr:alpha/beta hydrolase [Alienimonas chondri]NNJ26397.1 Acetyl esterase [Alienimonas chondri]